MPVPSLDVLCSFILVPYILWCSLTECGRTPCWCWLSLGFPVVWVDGWTGFCYRRGCGRLGVGVCFGQGHSLHGFEQRILCMAVACPLISAGMRRGNHGCLGPAVQTKMGTVRTDLRNQSRVKGLGCCRQATVPPSSVSAGDSISIFCMMLGYFAKVTGPDSVVFHQGVRISIFSLTAHG